jgi:hypothetical protein
MTELGQNENVVALCADLIGSGGITWFKKSLLDGIAELKTDYKCSWINHWR